MSLVLSGLIPYPDTDRWAVAFGSTMALTGSGNKCAFPVTVPFTGTITHVGIRLNTVTSSQTIRVSLQTFDTSTGDPSGSNYGGSSPGTQAAPAATTSYRVALATPATATRGDIIFVVVEFDSTAGNLTVSTCNQLVTSGYPYLDLNTAAWVKSAGWPNLYLDYGGTVYDCLSLPYSALTQTTVNSGTTPDEYAAVFVAPFPCRVCGFKSLGTAVTTSADCDYVLYDSSSSALATKSISGKRMSAASANRPVEGLFDAGVVLTAGATYRLSVKPSTANNVNVTYWDFPSAAAMDALPGGQSVYYSTRTDAGSWTDVATRRLGMSMLIDQFDNGAGTGGLIGGGRLDGGLQ